MNFLTKSLKLLEMPSLDYLSKVQSRAEWISVVSRAAKKRVVLCEFVLNAATLAGDAQFH